MTGAGVRLLFCLVVCLAVIGEIRGPPSPPRRSTTRTRSNRSTSPLLNRARTGLTRILRSVSPPRRYDSNLKAGSSRSRVSRGSGSRSRSSSPEMPTPPFPYTIIKIMVNAQSDLDLLERFRRMHQEPGDSDMTLRDFKSKKSLLLRMVESDICHQDRKAGGDKCVEALKEFQSIPRDWRGPCGDAFTGACQDWSSSGWSCSFIMKISRGYTPPITGYTQSLRDCVNALSPEEFEKHLNSFADNLLNV